MYSRECYFRAEDYRAGISSRDAVDGFSAIAAALDNDLDERAKTGGKIVDMMVILLSWALLAAVIFYPALQLAAITASAGFFCMRPFIRYVFGPGATTVDWSPGMLSRDNLLLARV